MKVGIIFGGKSTEHDVSVVSGTSVIKNINKEKYEIHPIYIERDGTWYTYDKKIEDIDVLKIGEEIKELTKIENITEEIKKFDVIFPVLHGLDGEDGSIQGMLKMLEIPYVGCGILASSIGLDKAYTKVVLEKANIKQAKYEYIRKFKDKYIHIDKEFNEKICNLEEIVEIASQNLKFPMFIKPSNFGSSVGITKANNIEELKKSIKFAEKFDKKIIIEQGIKGKEVECAVLGNEEVVASCVGEIIPADEFYSYDAKYKNSESKTQIPANIPNELSEKISKYAIKAFKAINGKGLSRVDFFIEENTNEIYINEINTLPGFTTISMYPKLFDEIGIKYTELLDKLIELALER